MFHFTVKYYLLLLLFTTIDIYLLNVYEKENKIIKYKIYNFFIQYK